MFSPSNTRKVVYGRHFQAITLTSFGINMNTSGKTFKASIYPNNGCDVLKCIAITTHILNGMIDAFYIHVLFSTPLHGQWADQEHTDQNRTVVFHKCSIRNMSTLYMEHYHLRYRTLVSTIISFRTWLFKLDLTMLKPSRYS